MPEQVKLTEAQERRLEFIDLHHASEMDATYEALVARGLIDSEWTSFLGLICELTASGREALRREEGDG